MDKDRKREITQSKDIPIVTKASLLYGDSTITRALIAAIPSIGGSLDLILSQKGKKFVQQRMEILISEISLRLDQVEVAQSTLKTKRAFMIYFSQYVRRLLEPSLKIKLNILLDCLVTA